MSRRRDTHRVSCKCALFSPDGNKVLVVDYGKEGYGLSGGHLDKGEALDQGRARELFEELGLENVHFQHADFMQHANGKIIPGYVGILDPDTE